jgi:hypothetical protein
MVMGWRDCLIFSNSKQKAQNVEDKIDKFDSMK